MRPLAHRLPILANSSAAATSRARTGSPTTFARTSPSPVGSAADSPNPNSHSQSNTQARRIIAPMVRTATSTLINDPNNSSLTPQAPEATSISSRGTQPTQLTLSASPAVDSEQLLVDQMANTFNLQPGSRQHLLLFHQVRLLCCFPISPIDYSDVRRDYSAEPSPSLHLPRSHEVPYLG